MQSPPLPLISADLLHAWHRSEHKLSNWTDATARSAYERYGRFLRLVADNPHRPVAPTRDIDEMWHLHMLAPVAYQRDCLRLFGHVLDHDGGFGQAADELPVLQRVFEETAARWKAKYGEEYGSDSCGTTKCWHDCQSRCWHACKNVSTGCALQ